MPLVLARSLPVILGLTFSVAGYSQIQKARSVAVPAKTIKDTVPLVRTTQPVKVIAAPQVTKALSHTKVLKNSAGIAMLQNIPMAVYGNDQDFRQKRMNQYNSVSTEPSFSKSINGINIQYKLRKNPNYDSPPTASVQGTAASSEGGFNCTTTRESVSARSSSFLSVSADGAGIYPGAIYNYSDFYGGNVLKTVGDGKRNPITIYTNNSTNSTGEVAVNVTNPTASSIYSSIAPIVRNFSTATGSASSIGQYTYSNNSASLALNISAGGSYSGFSASAGFQVNKQDKHIYITCDYKIPLYTLATEIPVTGFFTDPSIESTPNLLLVSSVMYGTRILANIDIDESSLSDSAFATFKYGDPDKTGAKAAFDFLQRNRSQKITINTYTVGVAPQVSLHPTTIDELLQQIEAVIRSTTYQTAKPISYTLTDMAGNLIGVESATDVYTVKNCVPKAAEYRLVSAEVSIQTGNDGKDNGSDVSLELYCNGTRLVARQNGNTEFLPNQTVKMLLDARPDVVAKLEDFQAGNNKLSVFLTPKQVFLGWDAWDIKHITLKLKFEDQNGVPYPMDPTIEMNNSNVRLEKNRQRVTCNFNNRLLSTSTTQP